MRDIKLELQTAYFQALSAFGVPVYDFVPAQPVYPYIRIGEFTEVDNSDKSDYGSEVTVQIEVVGRFSASGGSRAGMYNVINQIKQIIRPNPFNLATHNVITCTLDSENTLRQLTDAYFYVYSQLRFRHETVNLVPEPPEPPEPDDD